MCLTLTIMNRKITVSLIITKMLLSSLLSLVPFVNTRVMNRIMIIAGKFIIPPADGAARKALGRCTPNSAKNEWT